ncbi:hypothetical protein XI09_14510 [Bradyrhizobium sp. CCBAU 11386]|nr:hypothetical protein [Bradyrhizobium sp. CCBAU 11386]
MLAPANAEQNCKSPNVGLRFIGKRSTCNQVLFISLWTSVVGRKKTFRSEAIEHLAKIRRTSHNIVVRIKRIQSEIMPNAQIDPCLGHDLH